MPGNDRIRPRAALPRTSTLATRRWRRSKPAGAGAHDRLRQDLIARETRDWRRAGRSGLGANTPASPWSRYSARSAPTRFRCGAPDGTLRAARHASLAPKAEVHRSSGSPCPQRSSPTARRALSLHAKRMRGTTPRIRRRRPRLSSERQGCCHGAARRHPGTKELTLADRLYEVQERVYG
jgi:hypothetical protein